MARALLTMLALGATATAFAAAVSPVQAAEIMAGPVEAKVLRVVDGDTMAVEATVWLGQRVETLVRMAGVDTPELRGRCAEEKQLALQAQSLMERTLPTGTGVLLYDVGNDKYGGRVIARVVRKDGLDLGGLLVESGLARPYAGGSRSPWCA